MQTAPRTTEHLPPSSAPVPWLVIPNGEGREKLIFVNVSDPRKNFIRTAPKEIHGKVCKASMHDWVLMMDPWLSGVQSFLWNPATQEMYELPRLDEEIDGEWLVVPPSNSSDLMVLFAGEYFFLSWQLKDHKWTKQEYELEEVEQNHHCFIRIFSFKNGKMYAFTNYGELAVIERESCGNLSVRLMNNFIKPDPETSTTAEYLVEFCEEVYLVVLYFGIHLLNDSITTGIFKMDFSKEAFVKVDCIGDRVFFISRQGSTSLSATKSGFKENCIYVLIHKELYKFDLEDESLSVSLPCPNMLPPSFNPFWYLPGYRSVECNEDAGKDNEIKTTIGSLNTDRVEELDMKTETKIMKLGPTFLFRGFPLNQTQPQVRLLIDLPKDILHVIAKRLRFATEYKNFRQVSKTISSSVPPIHLPTQYPLLMFSNRSKSWCSFSDPMENIIYSFDMPELLGARIRFSKDGWLLMSRDDNLLFLFNPFTKAIHQLPDLPQNVRDWHIDIISFSSTPTSQDCIVLAANFLIDTLTQIYLVKLGQKEWSCLQFEHEGGFFPSIVSPVFHDGAFYFLGGERFLGVFNVYEESWKILQTPQPCCSIQQTYLLECCGDIIAVVMGHRGRYVSAYKFDGENTNWQSVSDLKDQTFFLSRTRSISLKVISESMKNMIYFPVSFRDNFLSYSLETLSWHSPFADYHKEDIYDTSEKLRCTWIQPSFD